MTASRICLCLAILFASIGALAVIYSVDWLAYLSGGLFMFFLATAAVIDPAPLEGFADSEFRQRR